MGGHLYLAAMELIVRVHDEETLGAALEAGAGAVAVPLPRAPVPATWWTGARVWQRAAREQGCRFHLAWEHLVQEPELPEALDLLGASAGLNPDALVLRDPGLTLEARRRFPGLPVHAAGTWGLQNSPGLHLAASLGLARTVLESPLSLKDLALLRRQSSLALEVVLPSCRGYASLCLLEEYLKVPCVVCGAPRPQGGMEEALLASLEALSGLRQLGVEAIQVRGDYFPEGSLPLVLRLYLSVWEAPAAERPGFLAAARDVLAAFAPRTEDHHPPGAQETRAKPPRWIPSEPKRLTGAVPRGLWMEARGYAEAEVLARAWREPILLKLTQENYAAFLPGYRRWGPRRLAWRLPAVLPESSLAFYRKALETLRQAGYSRFVAGDWGAVALVKAAGGEVLGEQTLGVRNSLALDLARQWGVNRICLPPARDPQDWQPLLKAAPPGRFWAYLFQVPPLAVCSGAAATGSTPPGLRWVNEGSLSLLCKEIPEHLEREGRLLAAAGVSPLVVALPRSGLPWGRVPVLSGPSGTRGRPRK